MLSYHIDRTSFLAGSAFSAILLGIIYFTLHTHYCSVGFFEPAQFKAITSNHKTSVRSVDILQGNSLEIENTTDYIHENEVNIGQSNQEQSYSTHSVIDNWQRVLHSDLSEHELVALSEVSPFKAASAIEENQQLQNAVINKLTALPYSEQRIFLLNAVKATSDNVRHKVSQHLLSSDRLVDNESAVSIIMSMTDHTEKNTIIRDILQHNEQPTVIQTVLSHLKSADDKASLTTLTDDLMYLFNNTNNETTQGLALQTLVHLNPKDEQLVNHVSVLLSDSRNEAQLEGMNVLNLLVNDHGVALSFEQLDQFKFQFNQLADDYNQPVDNRIQALSALKLINAQYY